MYTRTLSENSLCYNCNKKQTGCAELLLIDKQERKSIFSSNHQILFTIEGTCSISYDEYQNVELEKGTALFIPFGSTPEVYAIKKSSILVLRFDPFVKLCANFSLEKLFDENTPNEKDCYILSLNEPLSMFITSLISYIKDGIHCVEFYQLKFNEFLFLLDGYYNKDILARFFQSVINKDHEFAAFIYNNWQSAKSVQELAALSNYSINSFGKKFKQVFNISPYKWLNDKRAGKIFQELTFGNKTLLELSDEYRFNTIQQFHSFCKKNFQSTPGNIRKKNNNFFS